jgi:hypothetical protein
MTRSAYVPPPGICECCGEPVDAVTHRYPPSGLAVGLCCLKLSNSELAQAYGRRLKKAAERPR